MSADFILPFYFCTKEKNPGDFQNYMDFATNYNGQSDTSGESCSLITQKQEQIRRNFQPGTEPASLRLLKSYLYYCYFAN